MADIPVTDDKPVCPCGGIVLREDLSERGINFWRCMRCGNAMLTKVNPGSVKFKRRIKPLWG